MHKCNIFWKFSKPFHLGVWKKKKSHIFETVFFFFFIGMAPVYWKRKHFLVLLEVRLEESTRKAWRSNGVTFKVKIHVAERCFGFNLKGSDCTQQSEDSHVATQLCPRLMQNWYPAGKVWDRFDSTKENPEKMNMQTLLGVSTNTTNTLVSRLEWKSRVLHVVMPTSVFSHF